MNKIDLLFKNLDLSEAEDTIKQQIIDALKDDEYLKSKKPYENAIIKAFRLIKETNTDKIKKILQISPGIDESIPKEDPKNQIIASLFLLYKIYSNLGDWGEIGGIITMNPSIRNKVSLDKTYSFTKEMIKKIPDIRKLGNIITVKREDLKRSEDEPKEKEEENKTKPLTPNAFSGLLRKSEVPTDRFLRAKDFYKANQNKSPKEIYEKIFEILDQEEELSKKEKEEAGDFISFLEIALIDEKTLKRRYYGDSQEKNNMHELAGKIVNFYKELTDENRLFEEDYKKLIKFRRETDMAKSENRPLLSSERDQKTPQQIDPKSGRPVIKRKTSTPTQQEEKPVQAQTQEEEKYFKIKIPDNRINFKTFSNNREKIKNYWNQSDTVNLLSHALKKLKEDDNNTFSEKERSVLSNFYFLYILRSREEDKNEEEQQIDVELNNKIIDLTDEVNKETIEKLKKIFNKDLLRKPWKPSNVTPQNPNRLPSAVERDKKEQEKKEEEDKEEASDEEKIAQALDIEPTAEQIKASKSEVKGKAKKEVQAKILNLPNENNDREYFDKIKKEAGSSRKKQKALEKVWNQYLKGIKQIAEQLRKKTYMTPEASYAMARSYRDLMLSKARTAILSGGVVRTGKRIADSWERSKERRKSGRTFRRTRRKEKRIHRTGDSVPFGKIRKNWDEEEGLTGAAKISGRIIKRKGKTLASRLKATASRADRLQDQKDKSRQERPLGDKRRRSIIAKKSAEERKRRRLRRDPSGKFLTREQIEELIKKEKKEENKEKLRQLVRRLRRTGQRAIRVPENIRSTLRVVRDAWKEEE